jgi:hypothetical protein
LGEDLGWGSVVEDRARPVNEFECDSCEIDAAVP